MIHRRINRQTLIKDWNQENLDNALILNLGRGLTSRYVSLLSSCLEIGRIVQLSMDQAYKSEEFLGRRIKIGPIAPQLADIISYLNPYVNIAGLFSPIESEPTRALTHCTNYVFHSGNNWREKLYLLTNLAQDNHHDDRSGLQKQTIVLSGASSSELRLALFGHESIPGPEFFMPQFRNAHPSNYTALASASLGLAEIVRTVLNLGESLEDILTLNFHSNSRTSWNSDFDNSAFDPASRKIGLIGTGAVGLMYLEAIYNLGFDTVYLWDYDKWEETNFSRAPHCIDSTGKPKAHSAKKHFSRCSTRTRFISRSSRFTEESAFPKVDLLVSAVDGFDNQLRVINYSQRNQIPLLLGGCTPFSSDVYCYSPGKTSSLLYQYDFLKQAYLDSIRKTHPHCTDPEADPSQVLVTSLCAAILAAETINVLSGNPLLGPLRYDMLNNPKIGYTPIPHKKDLGTAIPVFTPLDKSSVERIINNETEEIRVLGMPFNDWYEKSANLLNLQ